MYVFRHDMLSETLNMHKNHYVITLLGVVLHTLVWYELCNFSSKLTEVYFVFVVIDV